MIERRRLGLKAELSGGKTERELELELGDDYTLDFKKRYDIPDEEKYDIPSEVWEGHNVADFIDEQLVQKVRRLEEEERRRDEEGYYDLTSGDEEGIDEIREQASHIREKRALMKAEQRLNHTNKPRISRTRSRNRDRTVSDLKSSMSDLGLELDSEGETHFDMAAERSASREAKRARLTSVDRSRSVSVVSRSESCMRDPKLITKARRLRSKSQASRRTLARKGEGDRHIPNLRAKHLLSGKRKLGKTTRR